RVTGSYRDAEGSAFTVTVTVTITIITITVTIITVTVTIIIMTMIITTITINTPIAITTSIITTPSPTIISCVDNSYLSLNPPRKEGAITVPSADEDTKDLPGVPHTHTHTQCLNSDAFKAQPNLTLEKKLAWSSLALQAALCGAQLLPKRREISFRAINLIRRNQVVEICAAGYGRLSPTCESRRLQVPGPILPQLRGFKEFRGQACAYIFLALKSCPECGRHVVNIITILFTFIIITFTAMIVIIVVTTTTDVGSSNPNGFLITSHQGPQTSVSLSQDAAAAPGETQSSVPAGAQAAGGMVLVSGELSQIQGCVMSKKGRRAMSVGRFVMIKNKLKNVANIRGFSAACLATCGSPTQRQPVGVLGILERAAPVRLDLLRESRVRGGVRPEQLLQAEPVEVTGRMDAAGLDLGQQGNGVVVGWGAEAQGRTKAQTPACGSSARGNHFITKEETLHYKRPLFKKTKQGDQLKSLGFSITLEIDALCKTSARPLVNFANFLFLLQTMGQISLMDLTYLLVQQETESVGHLQAHFQVAQHLPCAAGKRELELRCETGLAALCPIPTPMGEGQQSNWKDGKGITDQVCILMVEPRWQPASSNLCMEDGCPGEPARPTAVKLNELSSKMSKQDSRAGPRFTPVHQGPRRLIHVENHLGRGSEDGQDLSWGLENLDRSSAWFCSGKDLRLEQDIRECKTHRPHAKATDKRPESGPGAPKWSQPEKGPGLKGAVQVCYEISITFKAPLPTPPCNSQPKGSEILPPKEKAATHFRRGEVWQRCPRKDYGSISPGDKGLGKCEWTVEQGVQREGNDDDDDEEEDSVDSDDHDADGGGDDADCDGGGGGDDYPDSGNVILQIMVTTGGRPLGLQFSMRMFKVFPEKVPENLSPEQVELHPRQLLGGGPQVLSNNPVKENRREGDGIALLRTWDTSGQRNSGRDTETVGQGATDRSVGETENGDTFLELKKQLASKSPHHYTKYKDFSSGMPHRNQWRSSPVESLKKELDTDRPSLVCKIVDPREHVKENDLDVVLSPQRRSFRERCHVTAAVSSQHSGSPLDKDSDRDYKDKRFRRELVDSKHVFERRRDDSYTEEEPEWFSAGPTSQPETTELTGFDDKILEEVHKGRKRTRQWTASVKEGVVKGNGGVAKEDEEPAADQEVPRDVILPKQSPGEFDFNESFFNLDKVPCLASMIKDVLGEESVSAGWFPNLSRSGSRSSSLGSTMHEELERCAGLEQAILSPRQNMGNYFAPIPLEDHAEIKVDILEMLQKTKVDLKPLLSNLSANKEKFIESSHSGVVLSVEEVEAGLKGLEVDQQVKNSIPFMEEHLEETLSIVSSNSQIRKDGDMTAFNMLVFQSRAGSADYLGPRIPSPICFTPGQQQLLGDPFQGMRKPMSPVTAQMSQLELQHTALEGLACHMTLQCRQQTSTSLVLINRRWIQKQATMMIHKMYESKEKSKEEPASRNQLLVTVKRTLRSPVKRTSCHPDSSPTINPKLSALQWFSSSTLLSQTKRYTKEQNYRPKATGRKTPTLASPVPGTPFLHPDHQVPLVPHVPIVQPALQLHPGLVQMMLAQGVHPQHLPSFLQPGVRPPGVDLNYLQGISGPILGQPFYPLPATSHPLLNPHSGTPLHLALMQQQRQHSVLHPPGSGSQAAAVSIQTTPQNVPRWLGVPHSTAPSIGAAPPMGLAKLCGSDVREQPLPSMPAKVVNVDELEY
ncbi:hypothetical protein EI555_005278, partial [Monodon monoceros]